MFGSKFFRRYRQAKPTKQGLEGWTVPKEFQEKIESPKSILAISARLATLNIEKDTFKSCIKNGPTDGSLVSVVYRKCGEWRFTSFFCVDPNELHIIRIRFGHKLVFVGIEKQDTYCYYVLDKGIFAYFLTSVTPEEGFEILLDEKVKD